VNVALKNDQGIAALVYIYVVSNLHLSKMPWGRAVAITPMHDSLIR
jgi:hypothetical protein